MSASKIAALLILSSLAAFGQDYKAGFKTISTYDSSRHYKPNAPVQDALYYRPIEIDLWYPADLTSSDTTASFVDFVNLLEQRSKRFDDTKDYDGLTEELLQYICSSTNCPDDNFLKSIKSESYVNAKSIDKYFPLVVYLAGFNGMSYENYMLLEQLAKNGFIVASVSSIGRYPGNMTMESEDLFEQIEDARFVIKQLTKHYQASNGIGLIGYSWGGLAASVLAMSDQHLIKAVVSLDGSEQFVYMGNEDIKSLTSIRESPLFKPENIRAPYLYLDSDIAEWESSPDSIYNMPDFISGDKLYLKIKHSTHEDFSSLSALSGENTGETKYHLIQRLTTDYLREKLKDEHVFKASIPDAGVTTQFSQPATITSAATGKWTLKGVIRDKKTKLPLAFASIGIRNKDQGTIADAKGEFELALLESNVVDTLRVSMIGYESRLVYLNDIPKKQKSVLNIHLQEKSNELKEVLVVDKGLTTKVLGNKSTSKFMGARFAPGDLGSEIAIKVKIKHDPTYLDTFSFNISYNTEDTATFRVNVYRVSNGLPGENMLTENIILKVNDRTGKIEADLSKYNVVVSDDIFIGLQWVEGKRNSGIVFSAALTGKGTYYRKASEGHWKKYPMGIGFNTTAKF